MGTFVAGCTGSGEGPSPTEEPTEPTNGEPPISDEPSRSASQFDPNDGFAEMAPWLDEDTPVFTVSNCLIAEPVNDVIHDYENDWWLDPDTKASVGGNVYRRPQVREGERFWRRRVVPRRQP